MKCDRLDIIIYSKYVVQDNTTFYRTNKMIRCLIGKNKYRVNAPGGAVGCFPPPTDKNQKSDNTYDNTSRATNKIII